MIKMGVQPGCDRDCDSDDNSENCVDPILKLLAERFKLGCDTISLERGGLFSLLRVLTLSR